MQQQQPTPNNDSASRDDVALPERRAGPDQHRPLSARDPNAERPAKGNPRIYVASLADYNAGDLVGDWIDADQDPEDLAAAITTVLESSELPDAEEWAIHDYEGFGALRLSEYETVETISDIAHGIVEHGAAYAGWADYAGSDRDELDRFEDVYIGHYRNLADYAEDILDDLGVDVSSLGPDWLSAYIRIDTDALATDLASELHAVDDADGGVHLYHP